MNRREMIAGATALVGPAHLPLAMAMQTMDGASKTPFSVNVPDKPKDLFCSTFTPELLSKSLLSASEWHPYPTASERETWEQVPKEIADTT